MRETDYKTASENIKPYPFVFVISVDGQERPGGMVAAWHMKCSFDPPLIAVSLSKKGNTGKLIRQSRDFVVAVPNKGLEKEVVFFGTTHGNEVDKFRETGIKTAKAKHVRPPLIKDATVNFECRVQKEVDAGDHTIFIGEVLASYVNEGRKILFQTDKIDEIGRAHV